MLTPLLFSPSADWHQYSPLSDGYAFLMVQVEPEEAEPQPDVQGLTPPPGVLLFTFQPEALAWSLQFRETESYLKNWDRSGLTRRHAGPRRHNTERVPEYCSWVKVPVQMCYTSTSTSTWYKYITRDSAQSTANTVNKWTEYIYFEELVLSYFHFLPVLLGSSSSWSTDFFGPQVRKDKLPSTIFQETYTTRPAEFFFQALFWALNIFHTPQIWAPMIRYRRTSDFNVKVKTHCLNILQLY